MCIIDILQIWSSETEPFICPNWQQMVQILEWTISETWIWAWVVEEPVSPPTLSCPYYQDKLPSTVLARSPMLSLSGGRVSFPALIPWGQLIYTLPPELSPLCDSVESTLSSAATCERLGQLSSHTLTLGAGSPVPSSSRSVPLCCPGRIQSYSLSAIASEGAGLGLLLS